MREASCIRHDHPPHTRPPHRPLTGFRVFLSEVNPAIGLWSVCMWGGYDVRRMIPTRCEALPCCEALICCALLNGLARTRTYSTRDTWLYIRAEMMLETPNFMTRDMFGSLSPDDHISNDLTGLVELNRKKAPILSESAVKRHFSQMHTMGPGRLFTMRLTSLPEGTPAGVPLQTNLSVPSINQCMNVQPAEGGSACFAPLPL